MPRTSSTKCRSMDHIVRRLIISSGNYEDGEGSRVIMGIGAVRFVSGGIVESRASVSGMRMINISE